MCVMVHFRTKGEVGTVKIFKPSNYFVFEYALSFVPYSLVITIWERDDLRLSCV